MLSNHKRNTNELLSDKLDFNIFHNDNIDGKVFLQFTNNEPTNPFLLEILPRLCQISCSLKYTHKHNNKHRDESLIFSLDLADKIQTSSLESIEQLSAYNIPSYIHPLKTNLLKATKFPYELPIHSVSILIVNGLFVSNTTTTTTTTLSNQKDDMKNVCIMKTFIEFRSMDLIKSPIHLTNNNYYLDEILFNKMTLLRSNITIPKPFFNQVIDNEDQLVVGSKELTTDVDHSKQDNIVLESSLPYKLPSLKLLRNRSPVNNNNTNNNISTTIIPNTQNNNTNISINHKSLGFFVKLLTILHNKKLEIIVYLLLILIWLVIRSIYLTNENQTELTIYTIIIIITLFIIIFSFRSYTLKYVLRILFPNSNNLNLADPNNNPNVRSFFVNSWNAWGYCGVVIQGQKVPIYSMPSLFVKAFHHGGVGTSLPINLGTRDMLTNTLIPSNNSNINDSSKIPHIDENHFKITPTSSDTIDYIASDMFTVIADNASKYGLVIGFLSQKQQFGCISLNKSYNQLSIHISGDRVLINSMKLNIKNRMIHTDWLAMYAVNNLIEPFKVYMYMSSLENEVYKKALLPIRVFANETSIDLKSNTIASPLNKEDNNVIDIDITTSTTNKNNNDITFVTTNTTSITTNTNYDNEYSNNTCNIPSGWCSWYHFYEKISEIDLVSNLEWMNNLRTIHNIRSMRQGFNLFQVDDGYQSAWGDWTLVNQKKFPTKSLYSLVQQIKQSNMLPGLWFAPFSCDKFSTIAKEHPNWILKRNGSSIIPSNSANCGKFFYGLDTTNPEVQEHIRNTIDVATNIWGFSYLKLDFLYSAVLADVQDSYYDRTLTRAQIIQNAMQLINDSVKPNICILGCGAPLGSVIGYVHANRISADAGLSWNPDLPLPQSDAWNLPCARNMIRNTLNRLFLHKHWWINDPDCIMLRDSLCFTNNEIKGIATAKALSGGSFIISDDLKQISSIRFRILMQLLPPTNEAAIALDLLEQDMPEIFRLELYSNYMKYLLNTKEYQNYDINNNNSMISSTITTTATSSIKYNNDNKLFFSDSNSLDQQTTSDYSNDNMNEEQSDNNNNNNNSSSSKNNNISSNNNNSKLTNSQKIKRLHINKSHLLKINSDSFLKNIEDLITTIITDESELIKEDLLGNYIIFTVCNWSTKPFKSHYINIKDLFSLEYIELQLIKRNLLDNLILLRNNTSTNNLIISQFNNKQKYLLHIFNFWNETYHNKVITLDNNNIEDSIIDFNDIPYHSAYIYSISLSIDSTLPKYIGSNLHFSCGQEIHQISITNTPGISNKYLNNIFNSQDNESIPSSILNKSTSNNNKMNVNTNNISFKSHPIIKSMYISFEECSLRDHTWGGYIWVFLPINSINAIKINQYMKYIHITGSAAMYSTDTKLSHSSIESFQNEYSKRRIELVTHVLANDCNVEGGVYRISVESCNSDSNNHTNKDNVNNYEYVIISWIYDVI